MFEILYIINNNGNDRQNSSYTKRYHAVCCFFSSALSSKSSSLIIFISLLTSCILSMHKTFLAIYRVQKLSSLRICSFNAQPCRAQNTSRQLLLHRERGRMEMETVHCGPDLCSFSPGNENGPTMPGHRRHVVISLRCSFWIVKLTLWAQTSHENNIQELYQY